MLKIGVVKDLDMSKYPVFSISDFQEFDSFGIILYKAIIFDEYSTIYPFDYIFETQYECDKFFLEAKYPPLYKYFLIPTELVANIKHYAGFVKDAYPELMFDVVLSSESIPVEDKTIKVVTNSLSVIPCAVTRWTDEGLMVLDAVVENWNYSVPSKRITFDVKFESYNELIAFRNSNTL